MLWSLHPTTRQASRFPHDSSEAPDWLPLVPLRTLKSRSASCGSRFGARARRRGLGRGADALERRLRAAARADRRAGQLRRCAGRRALRDGQRPPRRTAGHGPRRRLSRRSLGRDPGRRRGLRASRSTSRPSRPAWVREPCGRTSSPPPPSTASPSCTGRRPMSASPATRSVADGLARPQAWPGCELPHGRRARHGRRRVSPRRPQPRARPVLRAARRRRQLRHRHGLRVHALPARDSLRRLAHLALGAVGEGAHGLARLDETTPTRSHRSVASSSSRRST